jgi:hypothetical protein
MSPGCCQGRRLKDVYELDLPLIKKNLRLITITLSEIYRVLFPYVSFLLTDKI